MTTQQIPVKNLLLGKGCPLTVISGPCVIESEESALRAAEFLKNTFERTSIQLIYKSSYDKANRLSIDSFRGPGLQEGLKILERVRREFDLPIFTDVHTPEEAIEAAEVCDVVQIPAFLCRQTDLVVAAGKTGVVVNLKKGQFMSPWDMKNIVEKLRSTGNEKILLTERGTSFGYNNLVSDMRSIDVMSAFGYPVFFDATHSVQLPGGHGKSSSGQRYFIPTLVRAALAAGADGIYAESHPDPAKAKSDASSVLPFAALPALLAEWETLYDVVAQCLQKQAYSSALSS